MHSRQKSYRFANGDSEFVREDITLWRLSGSGQPTHHCAALAKRVHEPDPAAFFIEVWPLGVSHILGRQTFTFLYIGDIEPKPSPPNLIREHTPALNEFDKFQNGRR